MKKVLITGGSGLLGTSLISSNNGRFEIYATYNSDFASPDHRATWLYVDLAKPDDLRAMIDKVKPDAIIHAGSIGSVDFAENNKELSHKINVEGTRTVVEAARDLGAHMIFVSSNAVFGGENPPYSEDDPTSPVNYYGELKVQGEQITLASDGLTSVIRPILMYGWPNEGRRGNLVTFWLSKLEAGEDIVAVNDVWSKPLWVGDAAQVCWAVVEGKCAGIFNVCGGEHVSLYDLANSVADVFGHDVGMVKSVPSSHFGDIASRPKDTSFTNQKIHEVLGVHPLGVADGLMAMRDTRVDGPPDPGLRDTTDTQTASE